jgi:Flp pilus assembly protein TadG
MSKNRTIARQRSGATTAELAVVLPIFVLMLFAFFELGHGLMISSIVENAAYEGARRGVVPGATQETAQQVAEDIAIASSLRSPRVQVDTISLTDRVRGITVTVDASMAENGIFLGPFLGNTTISRSTTMIYESDLRYWFDPSLTPPPQPTPRPRGRGKNRN